MDIKYLSKSYPNTTFFMLGSNKATGELRIVQTGFTVCIYLKEDSTKSESPHLNNPFFMTPLTDPYMLIDGHHYFDLSFYSNFTVMLEPPRFCFHDITGDPGISLNFPDKESYQDFYDDMASNLLIAELDLPGYYRVMRKMPPPEKGVYTKKDPNKYPPEYNEFDQNLIAEENKGLIQKFRKQIQDEKEKIKETSDNIHFNEALKNDDLLREYALRHKIPQTYKAIVWSRIAKIGDLPDINPYVFESFKRIKLQWQSVYKSQELRCGDFVKHRNSIWEHIMEEKQKFFVVIPNKQILNLSFNILMTICQMFHELENKHKDLMSVLRVFIALYTRKLFVNNNGEYVYYVNENVSLEQEKLEAAVFWSILIVLTQGEAKLFMTGTDKELLPNVSTVFDQIIKKFSTNILLQAKSNGLPKFNNLITCFSTCFSNILPFCDCHDLWIVGLASGNLILFLSYFASLSFILLSPTSFNLIQKPLDISESILVSLSEKDNCCWDTIQITLIKLQEQIHSN